MKLQSAVESLADETATGNWFAARQRSHSDESPGIQGPDGAPWRRRWALSDNDKEGNDDNRRWPYV